MQTLPSTFSWCPFCKWWTPQIHVADNGPTTSVTWNGWAYHTVTFKLKFQGLKFLTHHETVKTFSSYTINMRKREWRWQLMCYDVFTPDGTENFIYIEREHTILLFYRVLFTNITNITHFQVGKILLLKFLILISAQNVTCCTLTEKFKCKTVP